MNPKWGTLQGRPAYENALPSVAKMKKVGDLLQKSKVDKQGTSTFLKRVRRSEITSLNLLILSSEAL